MNLNRLPFWMGFSLIFAFSSTGVCQRLEGDILADKFIENCDIEFTVFGLVSEPKFSFSKSSDVDQDEHSKSLFMKHMQHLMNPLTNHRKVKWLYAKVYVRKVSHRVQLFCVDPFSISCDDSEELRVQKTAIVLIDGERTWSIQKPKHGMLCR